VANTPNDDRAARINVILEELRLNSEDLKELSKQAVERAMKMHDENQIITDALYRRRARRV
jgi:hypothetical protein